MIKKIYTILVLLFNLIVRRKHYKLHFVAENDPPIKRWYYDFKYWGFDHANLEMVSGADKLCELYSNGKDEVTVEIIASKKKQDLPTQLYDEFVAQDIIIDGNGAVSFYDVEISSPVTNTVEMTTQVIGNYDTFDISSLPTGSHVITIESPSGNIYEGAFTKY